MTRLVSVVLILAVVWGSALAILSMDAQAAPDPVIVPGQTYVIVESCTVVVTEGGRCFGEIHKVLAVREDGWIDTQQCENDACTKVGSKWRVNLAHVYAFRPLRGGSLEAH